MQTLRLSPSQFLPRSQAQLIQRKARPALHLHMTKAWPAVSLSKAFNFPDRKGWGKSSRGSVGQRVVDRRVGSPLLLIALLTHPLRMWEWCVARSVVLGQGREGVLIGRVAAEGVWAGLGGGH